MIERMRNRKTRKNPLRHTPRARLTGWDRKTYEAKNAELKAAFKDAINRLGFDSALNVSDSHLAQMLTEHIWVVARNFHEILDFIRARKSDWKKGSEPK
jgi:hypothetical protein